MNRSTRLPPAVASPPRRPADEWLAMVEDPEFRALVAQKRRFLLVCWLLVVSSYFSLAVGVALAPKWFSTPLFGEFNRALLLASGEVLLVLVVAALYAGRASRDFDRRADGLARRFFAARRG